MREHGHAAIPVFRMAKTKINRIPQEVGLGKEAGFWNYALLFAGPCFGKRAVSFLP